MVLLELEEFTRLFFETQRLPAAGGSSTSAATAAEHADLDGAGANFSALLSSPVPHPPVSFLVFATAEVDALCCCHLLSSFLDARSLFLADQCDHPNISVEIEIVNGVSDILLWIDKHLAPLLGGTSAVGRDGRRERSRAAGAAEEQGQRQQQQQHESSGGEYVLPFYDRILFFGCGGLDDEEVSFLSAGAEGTAAAAAVSPQRDEAGAKQQQQQQERSSSSNRVCGAPAAAAGDTATMLAAATDFFLHETVRQRAVWLLRQQRSGGRRNRRKRPRDSSGSRNGSSSSELGFSQDGGAAAARSGAGEAAARAAAESLADAFSFYGEEEDEEEVEAAADDVLSSWAEPEELQRLERRLRSNIRMAVIDARRPVHPSLIEDSRWWMPLDASELAAVEEEHRKKCAAAAAEGRGGGRSAARRSGVYWSTPCACLLARVLQPQYDIDSSTFAYGGAVAAASFLLQGYATEEEYNSWLLLIKDINVSRFPYVEEDDNAGLLPLLRIGCLQDSIGLSVLLLFRSLTGEEVAAPAGAAARSWHLQQLSNELRVHCGLQAKDILNPFMGLAASQQRRVYDYLRETLHLRDRLCLNWIRHVSQAKERGSYPSLPNMDAALFLHAVLAQRSSLPPQDGQPQMPPYRKNAIHALQLLRGITTQFSQEKRRALQQLQHAHALVSQHLLQLFKHLDFCRSWAARRGVLLLTLRHPASFLLDPHYLRRFALLCALKHANGRESKRLPTVLHVCVEGMGAGQTSRSLLYACTPNASAEKPDIFPAVLRHLVLGPSPRQNSIRVNGDVVVNGRGEESGGRERRRRREGATRGNGEPGRESEAESEESASSSSEEESSPRERRSRSSRELHRKRGRAGRHTRAGREEEDWNSRRRAAEKETLSKVVALDSGCVNLLHVTVQRLAADVQKQVAALYLLELRRMRRREEDEEEGREVDEEQEEEEVDEEEEDEEKENGEEEEEKDGEEPQQESEDDEDAEENEDRGEDEVGAIDAATGAEGNCEREEESSGRRTSRSEEAAARRRADSWERDTCEGSV